MLVVVVVVLGWSLAAAPLSIPPGDAFPTCRRSSRDPLAAIHACIARQTCVRRAAVQARHEDALRAIVQYSLALEEELENTSHEVQWAVLAAQQEAERRMAGLYELALQRAHETDVEAFQAGAREDGADKTLSSNDTLRRNVVRGETQNAALAPPPLCRTTHPTPRPHPAVQEAMHRRVESLGSALRSAVTGKEAWRQRALRAEAQFADLSAHISAKAKSATARRKRHADEKTEPKKAALDALDFAEYN